VSELVDLSLEERGEVIVVRLRGELDIAASADVGESIGAGVPNSARGLVVDLRALEFIDSSGVAMLFGLARRLGERRQVLRVVVTPGGAVGRVLELVELSRAARVGADLEEAVTALGGSGG